MNEINIPKTYKKTLLPDENVLAIAKKHGIWKVFFWLNILVLVLVGGFGFLAFKAFKASKGTAWSFMKADSSTWLYIFGGLLVAILIVRIVQFLIKNHIYNNDILVLTNKRLICANEPKLFEKDKKTFSLDAVDNIQEDESFIGNIIGFVNINVETRNENEDYEKISKKTFNNFKNAFYNIKSQG